MYKILLLVRESATQSLWTTYKISEVVDDVEQMVDFSTDDLEVLEATVKELIANRPQKTVKVIQDMDYVIDVVVGESV